MSMLSVGFEPTISAGERQQTYALDRAATGLAMVEFIIPKKLTDLTTETLHDVWFTVKLRNDL